MLAVSDPAADVTSTQTWQAVGDGRATGTWAAPASLARREATRGAESAAAGRAEADERPGHSGPGRRLAPWSPQAAAQRAGWRGSAHQRRRDARPPQRPAQRQPAIRRQPALRCRSALRCRPAIRCRPALRCQRPTSWRGARADGTGGPDGRTSLLDRGTGPGERETRLADHGTGPGGRAPGQPGGPGARPDTDAGPRVGRRARGAGAAAAATAPAKGAPGKARPGRTGPTRRGLAPGQREAGGCLLPWSSS